MSLNIEEDSYQGAVDIKHQHQTPTEALKEKANKASCGKGVSMKDGAFIKDDY